MMNKYKVVCLVEDSPNGFDSIIVTREANDKGDALLSVLMDLHKEGLELSKVKKTKVFLKRSYPLVTSTCVVKKSRILYVK